jgi:methylenetetrahydrofolate dehydrogenase (NADP+)/methenyltetrahydrofolate cyclohydrolase
MAVIDGKAQATHLKQAIAGAVRQLGHAPGLATILVGEDPASAVYVANKLKACEQTGIKGQLIHLPATVSATALDEVITRLNADPLIDGILLQLPLPRPLDEQQFLGLIDPLKDVDGLSPVNYGLMATGLPAHIPCTPQGCLHLIRSLGRPLAGQHAVVIGRSRLVGRPMAELLLQQNCTVTIAHSHTVNLPDLTRQADILVAATGRAGMVKASWIKPGAVVIDVGINRVNGQLQGDVDFAEVSLVAGAITPVPGGVGPMTVAMLMANTLRAACRAQGVPVSLPELP